MDRLRVGEVELCYDLVGDPAEPVLVLVAGLGSSLATWDEPFVQLLRDAGFAVLRFDNRDSGQSSILDGAPRFNLKAAARRDRSVVTYTLDDLADDTAGLLDSLGVAPAHVLGVSLGGMIAQMTAARHPDKVRTLCSVMSTTGARHVGLPKPGAGDVTTKPPGKDRDSFVEGELENQRLIGSTRADLVDEHWRRARAGRIWEHGVHPRGTGRQLMAIVASGDRTEALHTISVPTLVVHGDADGLIDLSGGRATAAAIPGAELLVIPGLGHELPPGVWPELVAAVVANTRRRETVR